MKFPCRLVPTSPHSGQTPPEGSCTYDWQPLLLCLLPNPNAMRHIGMTGTKICSCTLCPQYSLLKINTSHLHGNIATDKTFYLADRNSSASPDVSAALIYTIYAMLAIILQWHGTWHMFDQTNVMEPQISLLPHSEIKMYVSLCLYICTDWQNVWWTVSFGELRI